MALTCTGVVAAALIGLAFNKPSDYLEVADPVIKWATMVITILIAGCSLGIELTAAELATALDPLKSLAPLRHMRDLIMMSWLGHFVFVAFGLCNHVLALKMRSRELARTQP